jgi:hypothetical protein
VERRRGGKKEGRRKEGGKRTKVQECVRRMISMGQNSRYESVVDRCFGPGSDQFDRMMMMMTIRCDRDENQQLRIR